MSVALTTDDVDYVFNQGIIDQWIEDLLSRDYGIRFNADYPIMRDNRGRLCGDAALYLAYRHAEINDEDPDAIFRWYAQFPVMEGGFHPSECILSYFTGIPLEDSCKLVWPVIFYGTEFDVSAITARDFVKVLKTYLKSGIVDWSPILPMVEPPPGSADLTDLVIVPLSEEV